MKTLIMAIAAVCCLSALVGCQGGEEAKTEPATTPSTSTPKIDANISGGASTASNAEMTKCAECQKEMAAADLKDHDGKMMCAACITAHGH